jgi:hypothetical protein
VTPLTDAQVAALTKCDVDNPGQVDANGLVIPPEYIEALALEVQQSRQRRCGDCQHWATHAKLRDGLCEQHSDDNGKSWFQTPPDWFCADFLAKAES